MHCVELGSAGKTYGQLPKGAEVEERVIIKQVKYSK